MSRKTKTRPTTAVSKQANSSQTSLPLYRVARLLAIGRKLKAMKGKGRDLTDRALQQWVASQKPNGMMAQIGTLVLDAIRRAERIRLDADKTQLPALVWEILYDDLNSELSPKLGRKPKLGPIGRAMSDNPAIIASKRPRHRPRLFELPTESNLAPAERKFFDYSLGCKARIENNPWPTAGLDRIADLFDNNLEELDKSVTDKEVAKDIFQHLGQGDLSQEERKWATIFKITPDTSIEAIQGRISRARERHAKTSYTLNLHRMSQKKQKNVKKKSGG